MKKSKQEKLIDRRIDDAYRAVCSGIAIDVMDIPKVFREGQRLHDAGLAEPEFRAGLLAFVQTIAKVTA